MRSAALFGRQCLRQSAPLLFRASTRRFASSQTHPLRKYFAKPNFLGRKILWSGAAGATLSPLAFVGIANDESEHGEKTHEEAMLEASRQELEDQVPKALQNSKKYRRGIYFFVDAYIVEPICTGLRFLHLVLIFVPVLVTIPVIWIGARQSDKDNERSGTIWWYGFLVGSMERAGAAFIKASASHQICRLS
jgi:aarF domain-containing kinase